MLPEVHKLKGPYGVSEGVSGLGGAVQCRLLELVIVIGMKKFGNKETWE
jgi:hypothetical protein